MIDTSKLSPEELTDVVMRAQKRMGCVFDAQAVYDIVSRTIRKAELSGKNEAYVPILLENELEDFVMRERINKNGGRNYVRDLPTQPMLEPLPECGGTEAGSVLLPLQATNRTGL